ncbi:MAG: hypothetical protein M1459_00275 [Patescibacteria group bacterium]|nr:hypothetical protein [Patescibacteria group bacterium]
MRHTLLPIQDRKALRHDYTARFVTTLCLFLSLAAVIGAVALLPAYIHARNMEQSELAMVQSLQSNNDKSGLSNIENELKSDAATIKKASGSTGSSAMSDAVKELIALRGKVRIVSFAYNPQPKVMSMVIQGIAPTREELVVFKDRIQNSISGASVELPLSQLTKSSDIPFSVAVTYSLP